MEPASLPPSMVASDLITGDAPMPESLKVLCWRLEQLSDAGYSEIATAALAVRLDIDLHRATNLLLRGCPHNTALEILL